MPHHESADSSPQEQQRAVIALILGSNKGPAELERRGQPRDKARIVTKQRSCIETLDPGSRDDAIGLADAIRAGDLAPLAIPREKVQVSFVEGVQIDAAAGAFANRAIRHLAQSANLAQRR